MSTEAQAMWSRVGGMMAAATIAALATPTGAAHADGSAQDTIDAYQRQGYTVTIDRVGTKPMSQCVVTGTRNPQSTPIWDIGGDSGYSVFQQPAVLQQRSITISVNCN